MIWKASRAVLHRDSIRYISAARRVVPAIHTARLQPILHDQYRRYSILQDNGSTTASKGHIHNVATALKTATRESLPITVQAIVQTIRNQKKHSFVKLGDGSTTQELQVLLSPEQSYGISTGTVVLIEGLLQPSPPGRLQQHELHASQVKIIGASDPESYPIQKKYQSKEFLRTIPHLRLRMPWNGLLARLRDDVEFSCAEWFHKNGYIRTHPPIITSSDCEGAGEVFTISPGSESTVSFEQGQEDHFFKSPKYLTVSSQLHLEAYVHTHQTVWTLSPTFRAEKSDTPRHLSEFYMLEAELQTDSLDEVMHVVESLLRHITRRLQSSPLCAEILSCASAPDRAHEISIDEISSRWNGLVDPVPYPQISYTEAISHLEEASNRDPKLFAHPVSWGYSLALEHERYIASTIGGGNKPVFVTDYPAAIKPFYMLPSPSSSNDRQTVSSFDLLLPHQAELVGGSMREHRLTSLLATMEAKGVSKQGLEWYTALREHGSVPHGGFGLGFDRLLCYLAGEANIRDVVGWPRWAGRCDG